MILMSKNILDMELDLLEKGSFYLVIDMVQIV